MDLKRRLARLDRLTRKPGGEAPTAAPSGPAGDHPVPADLGLRTRETAAGPVWECEHVDPVPPPPDPLPDLTGLFTRDPHLAPAVGGILFLDTETTGLAGGTGTLVFQLGLSWWEDGALRTRQLFLPGPAHEPALLADLAATMARFAVVVSFNGASFDLPLLRTRALLNRLPDPAAGLAGWDLLVPARRLWGRRLPDCRQQSLEAHLLGRERGPGDIDGSRIPQTWFDFLADGRPGLLPNVLRHNRRDMVGMARIFREVVAVGAWLADGDARLPAGFADRAGAWSLGRLREWRRESDGAGACFAAALGHGWGAVADPLPRERFRRDAIRNLKRCARWDLVEELVADGLECRPDDRELHREGAILCEHRLGDLERARHHAARSGDPHRLARIERRLAGAPKGRDDREDDA